MTTRRLRAALLLVATVPLAAATAAALRAGHWRLYADRHRIELKSQPRRSCPDCRGAGGWWIGGANPETEACGCRANRRFELRVRLLPVPAWPDAPGSERPDPGAPAGVGTAGWPRIGKGPATPLPHLFESKETSSMPRPTTERLALFGTLLATFGELHPLCDHWVDAADAVSAFLGVSLLRGSSRQWYGWDSARASRLAGVDVAPRNAPLGVTASRLTHTW